MTKIVEPLNDENKTTVDIKNRTVYEDGQHFSNTLVLE